MAKIEQDFLLNIGNALKNLSDLAKSSEDTANTFDKLGSLGERLETVLGSVGNVAGNLGTELENLATGQSTLVDIIERATIAADEFGRSLLEATKSTTRDTLDDLTSRLNNVWDGFKNATQGVKDFFSNSASNTKAVLGLNTAFSELASNVLRAAAAYVSLKKAMQLIEEGTSFDTYERRFQALLQSNELGSAAYGWVFDMANQYRVAVDDMAAATNNFIRVAQNTDQLENLVDISARIAAYSNDASYNQVANAISQLWRTGRTNALTQFTGLRNLDLAGLTDARNAGDITRFISELETALEAINITAEGFEHIVSGAEGQWRKFSNTVSNYSRQAARGFFDAFEPAFERMNEFLDSDNFKRLFGALSTIFNALGAAASVAVTALTGVANFIADNLTPIAIVGGIALSALAAGFITTAIAALAAAAPILIVVGLVSAFVAGMVEAGVTAQSVFGTIGVVFQTVAQVIAVVVVFLQNIWADFANFFTHIFDDPLAAIARLFADFADTVLGIIEIIARGIDAIIPDAGLAAKVAGYRSQVSDYWGGILSLSADDNPFEKWDYDDIMSKFDGIAEAFSGFGEAFDNFDGDFFGGLDGFGGIGLDNIGNVGSVGSVGKIDQPVDLSKESLRYLLDITGRNWYNNVNVNVPQTNVQAEIYAGNAVSPEDIANIALHEMAVGLQTASAANTTRNYNPVPVG